MAEPTSPPTPLPGPARIPLSPDLRAIGNGGRIPEGDARVTRVHEAGGLAPMPIRKLPEPPDGWKAWRAWASAAPGVTPARRRWPRR